MFALFATRRKLFVDKPRHVRGSFWCKERILRVAFNSLLVFLFPLRQGPTLATMSTERSLAALLRSLQTISDPQDAFG